MMTKTIPAALLCLFVSAAAQAQSCPCNASATQLNAAAIQTLLSNKMVCAQVGSERWQEWHNGSSSGPVVDYKQGPGDPIDPSETVGTFAIDGNNGGRIVYTYGSQSYAYNVCQASGSYTFCGAAFGGRDISGAQVSTTAGLQACQGTSRSSTVKGR